jgi:hypothetical protein
MPEDRTFPRFLPRVGRKVRVAFGEVVDYRYLITSQVENSISMVESKSSRGPFRPYCYTYIRTPIPKPSVYSSPVSRSQYVLNMTC